MSIRRTIALFSSIILLFGVLVLRLYDLMQDKANAYASHATNSYRLVIDKSRGKIYDRNLAPLTSGDSVYKVAVLPSAQSKIHLKSALPSDEFLKIEERLSKGTPFVFETQTYIEECAGVEVFLVSKRYPEQNLATHLIGYCDNTFSSGIIGIEKAYNDLLSSSSATLSISFPTDAAGNALLGAQSTVSRKGYNSNKGVALTIDAGIQKIAEDASDSIRGKGSILVMDVKNGDILAAVSVPQYDRDNIATSIDLGDSALLNRNLCSYNIGSTYKIIVAAAALSMGYSPNSYYNCEGKIELGGTVFNCHKLEGHGGLNIETAFANSCNPYFIKLGQSVGKERLISLSSAFGLGEEINLCNNITAPAGNLPKLSEISSAGDLANISFGQGSLMATPVHIAKIISIIANGGYDINPSLVLGEVDEDKNIKLEKRENTPTRVISLDVANKIKQYMITTVSSGTGRAAKPSSLLAGGKTASAETGWEIDGEKIVQAWFSGFYPADTPKYAIVVLSEGGKSGAAACAPIFKKICDNLYEQGFCD